MTYTVGFLGPLRRHCHLLRICYAFEITIGLRRHITGYLIQESGCPLVLEYSITAHVFVHKELAYSSINHLKENKISPFKVNQHCKTVI